MTLTYERAHEIFQYNNGELYWKVDIGCRIKKGTKAGYIQTIKHKNKDWQQYWSVGVNNKNYRMHNIIFLMHRGYLPEFPDCVDHIDNNSLNNDLSNLRHATRSQNITNQKIKRTNTSGVKGVNFQKNIKKWRARITINKKETTIGFFDNLFSAAIARKEAEQKYYGEFAYKGN